MARTKQQQADREESFSALTGYARVERGQTLFIAREGNFLRVYTISKSGDDLNNITWHVGNIIGASVRDRDGKWYIHLTGGQYDKADQVRRDLSYYLFDDFDALRHRDI